MDKTEIDSFYKKIEPLKKPVKKPVKKATNTKDSFYNNL